jgi:predicted alpha/beta superfamily hydrolase
MKKRSIVALIVALIPFTAGLTFIISSDYFTGHFPWDSSSAEGVIHTKLYSAVLGEEREVIIHLPPNYDSTTTYPVMYVLDGSSEDRPIADKFDVLSTVGYTPKTIVVGIPNMTAENRQLNLVPPFMRIDPEDNNSPFGGADQFLSFMETELFPFIENNFSGSQDRLFTGNSRGGLLVMYSLVHKPDLFQARFCYSTPFWRQDNILVSKVSEFLSSTDTLNTFLYMSAGANENENIRNGLTRMTKTFNEKSPVGLIWHSDVTPNAVHQNNARISATIGIGKWSEYVNTIGH